MIEKIFAQTQCGEGTHSVTKDGVLTCVLDDPTTATVNQIGKFTNLDFSSPDAIQESMFKSLIPNLVDNVGEIAPMLVEPLTIVTSLVGIIPISAGVIVGMVLLFKKMRYQQKVNEQKVFQEPKKKFSFPKISFRKKKSITPEEIQQEIDSKERDLEVITDPEEAKETMQEIEEMVEDKKTVEAGGFLLPEDLDTSRAELKDPEKMNLEELENEIKQRGHTVIEKPDEIEITETPKLTVINEQSEEEIVKNAINTSSELMEDELESVIGNEDFEPSQTDIDEAKEHFTDPPPIEPSEKEIIEVQRLMKEQGLSQSEAIDQVVKQAEKRSMNIVEELTDEQKVIKGMTNERDIFKLDIPKKKKSKFQQSFEKSALAKKMNKKMNEKKEKKLRLQKTRPVLNDLGHKRMIEYAEKINEKMLVWAEENKLNDKALEDLKSFSLFASMCEMMADQKTSKKRYWTRVSIEN